MCQIIFGVLFFFFFSSRRRHTRYWRDWSSDVCSSDLSAIDGLLGTDIARAVESRRCRTADLVAQRATHRVPYPRRRADAGDRGRRGDLRLQFAEVDGCRRARLASWRAGRRASHAEKHSIFSTAKPILSSSILRGEGWHAGLCTWRLALERALNVTRCGSMRPLSALNAKRCIVARFDCDVTQKTQADAPAGRP